MADPSLLYLMRRPLAGSHCSLLPTGEKSSGVTSLVLLEQAVAPPPGFPGLVYRLEARPGSSPLGDGITAVSYRELLDLVAQHDRTIVL